MEDICKGWQGTLAEISAYMMLVLVVQCSMLVVTYQSRVECRRFRELAQPSAGLPGSSAVPGRQPLLASWPLMQLPWHLIRGRPIRLPTTTLLPASSPPLVQVQLSGAPLQWARSSGEMTACFPLTSSVLQAYPHLCGLSRWRKAWPLRLHGGCLRWWTRTIAWVCLSGWRGVVPL